MNCLQPEALEPKKALYQIYFHTFFLHQLADNYSLLSIQFLCICSKGKTSYLDQKRLLTSGYLNFYIRRKYDLLFSNMTVFNFSTESTNTRVLYFSIFSMCCLIGLATWQVFYLRRFFKAKKLIEQIDPSGSFPCRDAASQSANTSQHPPSLDQLQQTSGVQGAQNQPLRVSMFPVWGGIRFTCLFSSWKH